MLNHLFDPAQLQQLDMLLQLLLLVLLALGIGLIIGGGRRLLQRRFLGAALQGLSGLTLMLAGLLLLSIAMNLYTYQRLTYERSLARIHFTELSPQRFAATLTRLDTEEVARYELLGDEWQLDARIIKWRGPANLLGLDSQFRLERLSGRYHDVQDELGKDRSVFTLHAQDPVDYWALVRDFKQYLPWIDAYYGSATYLPMADDAHYAVSITQAGLLARPVNDRAQQTIQSW